MPLQFSQTKERYLTNVQSYFRNADIGIGLMLEDLIVNNLFVNDLIVNRFNCK